MSIPLAQYELDLNRFNPRRNGYNTKVTYVDYRDLNGDGWGKERIKRILSKQSLTKNGL